MELPEKITDLSDYSILNKFSSYLEQGRKYKASRFYIANFFIASLERFFSKHDSLENAVLIKEGEDDLPLYSFKKENGETIHLNYINSMLKLNKNFDGTMLFDEYYINTCLNKLKLMKTANERYDYYDLMSDENYFLRNDNIKNLIKDYRNNLKEGFCFLENNPLNIVKYFRDYDNYEEMKIKNDQESFYYDHFFHLNMQLLLLFLIEKGQGKDVEYSIIDNENNYTIINNKNEKVLHLDLTIYISKIKNPFYSEEIPLFDAIKNILNSMVSYYKNEELYIDYCQSIIIEKEKEAITKSITIEAENKLMLNKKRI